VLHTVHHRFRVYDGPAPPATLELEAVGHSLQRGVFTPAEIEEIRAGTVRVFDEVPPDLRAGRPTPESAEMFRYEMFNRSAIVQRTIGRRRLLDVVEPLLGENCHIIACTAWRNPADPAHAPRGQEWHTDAGPHVPRAPGVPWPENIPYPVFAVCAHVFLEDCGPLDGPTTLIPGTHRSGQAPPIEREWDDDLDYEGQASTSWIAEAGDVGFFVSDIWHRRLPPQPGGSGRFFLQVNYSRRDLAQRVLPTSRVNHTTAESEARATTDRERRLIGLHPEMFYDG